MHSIAKHFTVGRAFGLFLSLLVAGSAYAGPSTQYWGQSSRQREQAAVTAQPTASPAAPTMACPKCQSRVVEEFSATNTSGKLAPHSTRVGMKHECVRCSGTITTIRGHTTNEMADSCPVCAQAKPTCCTAKS